MQKYSEENEVLFLLISIATPTQIPFCSSSWKLLQLNNRLEKQNCTAQSEKSLQKFREENLEKKYLESLDKVYSNPYFV